MAHNDKLIFELENIELSESDMSCTVCGKKELRVTISDVAIANGGEEGMLFIYQACSNKCWELHE